MSYEVPQRGTKRNVIPAQPGWVAMATFTDGTVEEYPVIAWADAAVGVWDMHGADETEPRLDRPYIVDWEAGAVVLTPDGPLHTVTGFGLKHPADYGPALFAFEHRGGAE